jgi:nucleotide-binding universal stress UspA family protein
MKDVLERHLDIAPKLVEAAVQKAIGRPIKVRVVTGAPAHEIARNASPRDIIVCGTHGRSALGKLVFGSVAAKLLREAPGPLCIVRPAEDDDIAGFPAVAAKPIAARGLN